MNAYGIKEVVAMSGLSENYIRKEIAKGDLKVTKGFVSEDSRIPKNFITVEDYEAWMNSRGGRSRRADGRNKFVIYMTAEEELKLREMIDELEFASTLDRANKPAAEVEAE